MTRLLLVDDDPRLRLALAKALGRKGVHVTDLSSGEDAIEPLRTGRGPEGPVDVCILDLRMPGMGGLEVLKRTVGRKVPVVVLTGHGTIKDTVEAMRLGAANFVQKPVDADELWPIIEAATKDKVAEDEEPKEEALLGASPAMMAFLDRLDLAADSEEPVLLLGETGTGKELCARRVHRKSHHRKGPFVPLNAAAVPRDLFESELFGHRRGSFTGAAETREGLMAKAGEGTLFIDEVGDMPLDAQAKVLRALEDRKYRPLGSDQERPFKARLCAATHRDLTKMVEKGEFRADLYYRLSVVPLHVPSLRERGDDVVLIARAALGRATPEGRALSMTPEGEERLRHARFAGNVRELVNVMKRAAIFARGDVVDAALLDDLLRESPFVAEGGDVDQGASTAPRAGERVTLEELEKIHIRRLLDELQNVSEVARIVGIDRRTLQRKMAAWGFRDS